jgi:hypothetical protein
MKFSEHLTSFWSKESTRGIFVPRVLQYLYLSREKCAKNPPLSNSSIIEMKNKKDAVYNELDIHNMKP